MPVEAAVVGGRRSAPRRALLLYGTREKPTAPLPRFPSVTSFPRERRSPAARASLLYGTEGPRPLRSHGFLRNLLSSGAALGRGQRSHVFLAFVLPWLCTSGLPVSAQPHSSRPLRIVTT